MKNILLSFSLIAVTQFAGAQAFTQLSIHRNGQADDLAFLLKKECNVRYYLIEASRDSLGFEIISRIDSKGNTIMPRSYCVRSYDTAFRYYRVRRVGMDELIAYSNCSKVQAAQVENQNLATNPFAGTIVSGK